MGQPNSTPQAPRPTNDRGAERASEQAQAALDNTRQHYDKTKAGDVGRGQSKDDPFMHRATRHEVAIHLTRWRLMQGCISRGPAGYYGPRPPVGDPAHHCHFQVFALDTVLSLPFGASRDELLTASRGHVIAKGERVVLYQQTVKPPK